MKNHIGYGESTAFICLPRLRAGEKESFPTKNTLFATFFAVTRGLLNRWQVRAFGFDGGNLPDFVVRAVSCLTAFAWVLR
jgi:hypothetical protein